MNSYVEESEHPVVGVSVATGEGSAVGGCVSTVSKGQLLHDTLHSSCTSEPLKDCGQNLTIRSAALEAEEVNHVHFLESSTPFLVWVNSYVEESEHPVVGIAVGSFVGEDVASTVSEGQLLHVTLHSSCTIDPLKLCGQNLAIRKAAFN